MSGSWIIDIGWSPDGRFIYYYDHPTARRATGTCGGFPPAGGDGQDLGLASRYFRANQRPPGRVAHHVLDASHHKRTPTGLGDGELPAGGEAVGGVGSVYARLQIRNTES